VVAAQLVHAAGESSPGGLAVGTRAVVLAVDNESELEELRARSVELGVGHRAVYEPDVPWNGQLMALGLVPVRDRAEVRAVTHGLCLLRKLL
jgi:hypothetical protein